MGLINHIIKFLTATRLRKVLSSILATLILLTSIRYIFISPKEVKAADVYLGMNEGYGTTNAVNDTNGSVSAGSITNAVWKTEDLCKSGKCLYFDGTGDYVAFAHDTDLDMAASDNVTVEGWFRTPDITSGSRSIISKYETTGADGGYRIYINSSGQIVFGIDSNNTDFPLYSVTSTAAFDDNKWHHFSAVKSGTASITLYIDAVSVGTTSIASTAANNGDSFYIGRFESDTSQDFLGFIDEVKVLRTARTADQIKADFLGGTPSRGTSASFGPDNSWISNGLVGYWKMDEASWSNANCGTTKSVLDSSGNTNHGSSCPTSTGPTGGAAGKFGNGGSFDGTDDYLTISDNDSLSFSNNTMSAASWVKRSGNPAAEEYIILKGITTWEYNMRIGTSGLIGATLWKSTGATVASVNSTISVTDGNWHHVAIASDGNRMTLYIDGVLNASSTSFTDTMSNTAASLYFGDRSDSANAELQGSLDEVRLYNRTLSPSEIEKLYNWAPGPITYWKLDENTGITANDTSSNSNSGTLNGTPIWAPGKFGSGVSFDGTDDSISKGDDPDFDFTTTDSFTLNAWIKHVAQTSGQDVILSKFESTNSDGGYELVMEADGDITCGVDTDNSTFPLDSVTTTAATYDDNSWHHVSCVKDGASTLKLYIDGVLIDTDSSLTGTGSYANDDTFYVGRNGETGGGGGISHVATVTGNNTASGSSISVSSATVTSDSSNFYIAAIGSGNSTPGATVDSVSGLGLTWSQIDLQCVDNGAFIVAIWYGSGTPTGDGTVTANLSTSGVLEGAEIVVSRYTGVDLTDPIGNFQSANENGNDGACSESLPDTDSPSVTVTSSTGNYVYAAVQSRLRTITWSTFNARGSDTAGAGGDVSRVSAADKSADSPSTTAAGTLSAAIDWAIIAVEINADSADNEWWLGEIDDVKIYNYARTSAQVIEDMNAGHPAPGSPVGSAIGHWKFDEGYGDTAYDSSPQGKNGNLAASGVCPGSTNCPTWTNDGKYGKALSFDGSNDYVEIADSDVYDLNDTEDITISGWFNREDFTSDDTIIAKRNGVTSAEVGWNVRIKDTGTFDFQISDGTDEYSMETSMTFTAAGWNHFVVVWDQDSASNSKIFINAVEVAVTKTGTIANIGDTSNALTVRIGTESDGTDRFFGKLDNIVLYSSPFTADQVKLLYNQGSMAALGSTSTNYDTGTGAIIASNSAGDAYCPPGQTSACTPPIGHWKLDENTGSSANDSSGNGLIGNLTNGPLWVSGKLGQAVQFDNLQNQYISVASSSSLGFSGAFTISAWANTSVPATTQAIAGKDGNGTTTNRGYYIRFNGTGKISGLVYNDSGTACNNNPNLSINTSSTSYSTNTWYHIAMVYDGSNLSLYINGVKEDSDPVSGSPCVASSANFEIGSRDGGGNNMTGKIDDVRTYDYARTPAQIAWDYNRGGPVGWWKFDEANWGTPDCSTDVVMDSSGQGNHGDSCPATTGQSTPESGKLNTAMHFDDSNDYVSVPDHSSLDLTDGLTISAWVNSDANENDNVIVSKGTSYEMGINADGDLYWDGVGAQVDDGSTKVQSGSWHHVVITNNDTTTTYYIDGVVTGTSSAGIDSDNSTVFRIGHDGTNYFDGLIDDVRIFNYTLSAQQVKLIMNEGATTRFGPNEGSP